MDDLKIFLTVNGEGYIVGATNASNRDTKNNSYVIIDGDYESLYPLASDYNIYNYKYLDGQVVQVSQEDKQVILDAQKLERDNEEIKSQLYKADMKIIRALVEGDVEKINAHKVKQSELRAKLK